MADVNLWALTVPQLKDLLRARGSPVSGTKAELIARLQTPAVVPVYGVKLSHLTIPQLKAILKEQGLPVSGRKDELIARLQAPSPVRQPTVVPRPLSPVRQPTVTPVLSHLFVNQR